MRTSTEPVTTTTSTIDIQRNPRGRLRGEIAGAGVLFVLACIQMVRFTAGTAFRSSSHRSSALLFFMFLALSYLGLSVHAARVRLRSAIDGLAAAAFVGLIALLAAALAYALATGLPIEPRTGPYTAYLFVPAVLLIPGERNHWRDLETSVSTNSASAVLHWTMGTPDPRSQPEKTISSMPGGSGAEAE